VPNFQFQPSAVQNWHGLTPMAIQEPASHLNFNLSDPYGGYSMVWRQLIWFHDRKWDHGFGPDLLPKCQTFSQAAAQYWHGLTPMAIQEPASHLNFTYQTHMEDIQWSGGN
jgi:hypothetical protein